MLDARGRRGPSAPADGAYLPATMQQLAHHRLADRAGAEDDLPRHRMPKIRTRFGASM
jgi:hypothetical protein